MKKNKKAQVLDTILSNIIVFIALVLVITVFSVIAFGNILVKSPSGVKASSISIGKFLLLESTNIDNNEVLIIDILTEELEKLEPDTGSLNPALEPLVNQENNCALITKGDNLIGGYIYSNGKKQPLSFYTSGIISNPEHIVITPITVNGKTHKITTYYGKCNE
jgi:hypothetical protein